MEKICMVGTGYVGLVSGACFAHLGHKVICVDNNKTRIENLDKGIMPIYEKNLKEIVAEGVKNGNLSFTTSMARGVEESNVIFITVGTPALAS